MKHRAHPMAAGPDVALYLLLSALLPAATVCWMVPMMLWDHLDLVPVYEAWRAGRLWDSEFAQVHHGSHLHAAAYAVLLVTTQLSHGQPWLDGVASWLLLIYAVLVLRLARAGVRAGARRWLPVAAVLLALYPGHLSNLQWGWQVAVLLCLAAMALAVSCLAEARLGAGRNALALLAACLASFTMGLALVPVALLLIGLRRGRAVGCSRCRGCCSRASQWRSSGPATAPRCGIPWVWRCTR